MFLKSLPVIIPFSILFESSKSGERNISSAFLIKDTSIEILTFFINCERFQECVDKSGELVKIVLKDIIKVLA